MTDCGKKRYATPAEAHRAAKGQTKGLRRRRKGQRAYRCGICHGWHLTRKEERGQDFRRAFEDRERR